MGTRRKMEPKKLTRSGYSIASSLEDVCNLHQAILDLTYKFNSVPTMAELAKETGMDIRKVHRNMHHLKSLGIIDFDENARENNLTVIVQKNVESVIRHIYAKDSYLSVWTPSFSDKSVLERRFKKVHYRRLGNFVQAMLKYNGDTYWLDGWEGDEYLRDEPFWMKDYAMGAKCGRLRKKFELKDGEIVERED